MRIGATLRRGPTATIVFGGTETDGGTAVRQLNRSHPLVSTPALPRYGGRMIGMRLETLADSLFRVPMVTSIRKS